MTHQKPGVQRPDPARCAAPGNRENLFIPKSSIWIGLRLPFLQWSSNPAASVPRLVVWTACCDNRKQSAMLVERTPREKQHDRTLASTETTHTPEPSPAVSLARSPRANGLIADPRPVARANRLAWLERHPVANDTFKPRSDRPGRGRNRN